LDDELTDAVKKVAEKQLNRSTAIDDLSDAVIEKDDDLILGIVRDWMAKRYDERWRRQVRLAAKEVEREVDKAVSANWQPGFDDICSYFFPPDTFPPSTILAEAVAYAYDLLGRAERHHQVAEDRVAFVERMLAAVSGDVQVTLAQAVTALQEDGDAAASG
jgi:hypothetical protein